MEAMSLLLATLLPAMLVLQVVLMPVTLANHHSRKKPAAVAWHYEGNLQEHR